MLSEEEVLDKLEIPDFRHLNKEKVITFVSMLDQMDPEVAKKALEQFPEFANTMRHTVSEYKKIVSEGLLSNDESVKAYYAAANKVLDTLIDCLKDDEITPEERASILSMMHDVLEKVDAKDTENKSFINKNMNEFRNIALGIIALGAVALGGRFLLKK